MATLDPMYPGIADAIDRLKEAAHRDSATSISVRAQDLRNVLAYLEATAPSWQAPFEGVADAMVDAALDGADYIPNSDNRKWMRAALEAALLPASAEPVASLDERMKAAGMIPLSDLLAGNTPTEKWMAHTGVRDLASFEEWLLGRHREFLTMRMRYELGDKDKTDELYEWVFAHAGAFGEVAANFRAMKERSSPPASGAVEAGWQLVPKEPTPTMEHAALVASREADFPVLHVGYDLAGAALVYKAMLSAAPTEGK